MTTKKETGLHGFLGGPSVRARNDVYQGGDSETAAKPAKTTKSTKKSKATKAGNTQESAKVSKPDKTAPAGKGGTESTPPTARTARTVGTGEAKRTATTDLPPSLYDYARDAAYWRRETLTEIMEQALRDWLERAELENGGSFLARPRSR